ncbi:MAG: hypothetical protein IJI03_12190 [Rudaea sp.]|nr:hypothetical protein [Rudaea sp.]
MTRSSDFADRSDLASEKTPPGASDTPTIDGLTRSKNQQRSPDAQHGDGRIEALCRNLAASRRTALLRSRRDNRLSRLSVCGEQLRRSIAQASKALAQGARPNASVRWLLENAYVIETQLDRLRRSFSVRRSGQLPAVLDDDGMPVQRALDLASQLVREVDGGLDKQTIVAALKSYQTCRPLDFAELWALPDMFALALLERLAAVAVRASAGVVDSARASAFVASSDDPPAVGQTAPPYSDEFIAALASAPRNAGNAIEEPWRSIAGGAEKIRDAIVSTAMRQVEDETSTSRCINSLRFVEQADWRTIVATVSAVEDVLALDPAGHYKRMDFATRNVYRQAVARLARKLTVAEIDVAYKALALARAEGEQGTGRRESHIGYFLLDEGVDETIAALSGKRHIPSIYRLRRTGILPIAYLLAQLIGLAVCVGPVITWLGVVPIGRGYAVLTIVLLVLVVSQLSTHLVEAAASILRRPTPMPRMDYQHEIPDHASTLVVVPCLLNDPGHVRLLVDDLRTRFLSNRMRNIRFALLSDYADAHERSMPGDAEMLKAAADGIRDLNTEYGSAQQDGEIFYLFHRDREWNPTQNRWMGHERKRGKLAALNALLLRGNSEAFSLIVGDPSRIGAVRYVITLDSDTQLPWDGARRMIETIDHPLNRPALNKEGTSVVAGYTIIQPRVGHLEAEGGATRYARLFGGETGLDQYTRSSADLYHDLFGEGSYTGKGIYDVAAFDRLLEHRFPDNRILSHDLIEGCFARATVATDVVVFEEYPATYAVENNRRQRWIRGDWQIAAWLGPWVPVANGRCEFNRLSLLSRWKLLNNLRRSLFEPAALALLILAWFAGSAAALLTIAMLLPFLVPAVWQFGRTAAERLLDTGKAVIHEPIGGALGIHLGRAIFRLACLPYAALQGALAIFKTFCRVHLTHRNLLEWVAFDVLQRRSAKPKRREVSPDLALLGVNWAFCAVVVAACGRWQPAVLIAATPWFGLWAMAPFLEVWSRRRAVVPASRLAGDDIAFVRSAARRTWSFFEDYVDERSCWLPPDNVRELPVRAVAGRTSPTNMGLGLLSAVAAHDLGYIDTRALLDLLGNMLRTLDGLQRYHGHLYNWYDTQTLEPMSPPYVSVVDSGNFVGHVLVLRQTLSQLGAAARSPMVLVHGVSDAFAIFRECATLDATLAQEFETRLRSMSELADSNARQLHADAIALAETANRIADSLALDAGEGAQAWADKLRGHCTMLVRNLGPKPPDSESSLIAEAASLIAICDRLADCDFGLFYDEERELLHIGMDVRKGKCDAGHYDMLASEARLTAYLAIARKNIPPNAWFCLGRLQTCENGTTALLSWSGSMFEYLMPNLVMPNFPGTLIDIAVRGAVDRQIAYMSKKGLAWGISESGYADLEYDGSYCYRAFGIPSLGLQPGLSGNFVIAPYASALALQVDPPAAAANLRRLANEGVLTSWGFYEAVDYGSRSSPGPTGSIVREFMAHHQGMSLLAFASTVLGDRMQRRFCSDPELKAAAILLKERMPKRSPVVSRDAVTEHVETELLSVSADDAAQSAIEDDADVDSLSAVGRRQDALIRQYCGLRLTEGGILGELATLHSLRLPSVSDFGCEELHAKLIGSGPERSSNLVVLARIPDRSGQLFLAQALALHGYSYCKGQIFTLILLVQEGVGEQPTAVVEMHRAIAASSFGRWLHEKPGGVFVVGSSDSSSNVRNALELIAAAELVATAGTLRLMARRDMSQDIEQLEGVDC